MKLVTKFVALFGIGMGVVFANPGWDVNINAYQYNGSVTSSVAVDGLDIVLVIS